MCEIINKNNINDWKLALVRYSYYLWSSSIWIPIPIRDVSPRKSVLENMCNTGEVLEILVGNVDKEEQQ